MTELLHLVEPRLLFGHDQSVEDPRDGLTLFGPLDKGAPYGIRAGVIGTDNGINLFRAWVARIQRPIAIDPPRPSRPPFPGFEAAFRIPWGPEPTLEIPIPEVELDGVVRLDDKHQRVFRTVDVFSNRILRMLSEEEIEVDVWFVVIPDDVYRFCRPRSRVTPELRIKAESTMPVKYAQRLQVQPSLFPEENEAAVPYHYDVNFRNQLKARLLGHNAPTQVIRESTIAVPGPSPQLMESSIAWNLSTAAFYKAGGRPWKLDGIRDGVCYLGLVFKLDQRAGDPRSSCCAAQMFLDSGDGVVFKGALGPWHNPGTGDFNLDRQSAKELVEIALRSYQFAKNRPPRELFIHGKTRFNSNEWAGFRDAVGPETILVGVRIRDENDFRLFRSGQHPVLRGTAYVRDPRTAFLWTKGFTPRLQTYPGMEVPKPLLVDVCKGDAAIETVLSDIMSLTKLNYNSCRFADGSPVTLTFADRVGEVLTAGPVASGVPLPFKYYI